MRTLAYWSRSYAVKAYAAARDAGVLPPPPATGPIPGASTEADLELAKVGLAGYRRILDG